MVPPLFAFFFVSDGARSRWVPGPEPRRDPALVPNRIIFGETGEASSEGNSDTRTNSGERTTPPESLDVD
jgi:hypothetical protein